MKYECEGGMLWLCCTSHTQKGNIWIADILRHVHVGLCEGQLENESLHCNQPWFVAWKYALLYSLRSKSVIGSAVCAHVQVVYMRT